MEAWQITGVTGVTRGHPGVTRVARSPSWAQLLGGFLETSKLIAKIRMGYDGLVAVFNGLLGKSTPETRGLFSVKYWAFL